MWTFIALNLLQLTDSKGQLNKNNVIDHKPNNTYPGYIEAETGVTGRLSAFT